VKHNTMECNWPN